MMKRPYYTDSYKTEFDAKIVAVTTFSSGSDKELPAVELDASYFYPTSGGQAFDTGSLGEWRIVDVVSEKSGPGSLGRVLHLLDADSSMLPTQACVGQIVRGVVDWPRRYDHMQQHSGQHLLSHAFFHLFGYETVSVHFGAVESTLDLAVDALRDEELRAIERYVTEVVYANLPIQSYFVGEQEIAALPLRRPPKVTGEIRVVEIEGIDYSACGGTHCRSSGELGLVKLLRTEKSRKNKRVAFVCGWRAQADYGVKHQLLLESAKLFSTDISQVPPSIERVLEQNKLLGRRVESLNDELLTVEAQRICETAGSVGEYRVVAQVFDDREIAEVKKLAVLLQEDEDVVVLFAVRQADQLTAIFARGKNVLVKMGSLLHETLRQFGGNGGGRPEFAQGGKVDAVHAHDILENAMGRLHSELTAL